MCVPWEANPQPFALLTTSSTTEPHDHSVFLPLFVLWNISHIIFATEFRMLWIDIVLLGNEFAQLSFPILQCSMLPF